MPVRVALCGRSGAGKSTVAAFLSNRFSIPIYGTGTLCREISQILFGDETKSHTNEITDALRVLHPSIFLLAAIRSLREDAGGVIDSLRWVSDLDLVRSRGFIVMRVEAPLHARIAWLRQRGQAFDLETDINHITETEADSLAADVVIPNDGSKKELFERLMRAIKSDQAATNIV